MVVYIESCSLWCGCGCTTLTRPDGSLTHCPKEKAALFADVFDSNDNLPIPQPCFPEAELTTFAFRSGEVKKLLLELDPYGSAGPDGIFPLFFVKTANYLPPKISTVLHKLVRIGGFSMCWGLVISHRFPSLAVPVLVLLTIVLLQSPQCCLKFLSACWLSV